LCVSVRSICTDYVWAYPEIPELTKSENGKWCQIYTIKSRSIVMFKISLVSFEERFKILNGSWAWKMRLESTISRNLISYCLKISWLQWSILYLVLC